jgi:hypothetical protein
MRRLLLLLALFTCTISACAPPPVEAPAVEAPVVETPRAEADGDVLFLDTLQERTFDWFWETTSAETGLVPDRWPTEAFSSVAAVGFGLTAYGVGAERGWVTRAEAAERTLTTLRFFWEAPQGPGQVGMTGYKGFFYHFLNQDSGERYRGTELSTIDTALLLGGALFAREYFDGPDRDEAAIRAYADSLYQRVEWDWFNEHSALATMAWRPEVGYGRAEYQGYNEAMLLYILSLGSPTFPGDAGAWDRYTSTYTWADFYGYEHVNFTPLFGHQYSHVWVDFRGIQDDFMREKGIDYFENSRRATLSQRAYAQDNPLGWRDYGGDIWGLTACDGPSDEAHVFRGEERQFHTYWARGASAEHVNDDGTIAPTAAGGSIPFAPEVAIPALRAMRDRYGDRLFTEYGFRDAFNPSFTFEDAQIKQNSEVTDMGWFDHDYLGIDQGPILLMAENLRSGLVWETMKRSPYVVRGLKRAGFTGGWLDGAPTPEVERVIAARQPEPGATDDRLVVVLGSSTAEGAGPTEEANTWVNRLRALLNAEAEGLDVLNLARGGTSTYHILPTGTPTPDGRPAPDPLRNITAALARDPAAIVIGMTSNDAAYGYTLGEQERNFEAVAAAAEAAGVPVWVTTTAPRNFDAEARAKQEVMRDWILERFGERAVDVWSGFARPDGGLDPRWDSGDGVHQNDEAHDVIFRRVRDSGLMDLLFEPTEAP